MDTPPALPAEALAKEGQPPKPKFKLPILIAGIVLFLLIIGGASAGYLFLNKQPEQIACTQEVKICPDGSSVGRTGPKCEFAPCPSASPQGEPIDETASWKTYSNSKYKFSFKYPIKFSIRPLSTDDGTIFLERQNDDSSAKWNFAIRENPQNLEMEAFFKGNKLRYEIETYERISINNYEWLIRKQEIPTNFSETNKTTKYVSFAIKGNGFIVTFGIGNLSLAGNTPEDEAFLKEIIATLKFTDQKQSSETSQLIQKSISPDGLYIIEYTVGPGDFQKISIKNKQEQVLVDNIITSNWNEIVKKVGGGQIGYKINGWRDDATFILELTTGDGKIFSIDINAPTGKIVSN